MITDDKSPVANIRLISVASSFLHFKYCLALMNIEPRYMFDENVVADISIDRRQCKTIIITFYFAKEIKLASRLRAAGVQGRSLSIDTIMFNGQGWTLGKFEEFEKYHPSLFRVYYYRYL